MWNGKEKVLQRLLRYSGALYTLKRNIKFIYYGRADCRILKSYKMYDSESLFWWPSWEWIERGVRSRSKVWKYQPGVRVWTKEGQQLGRGGGGKKRWRAEEKEAERLGLVAEWFNGEGEGGQAGMSRNITAQERASESGLGRKDLQCSFGLNATKHLGIYWLSTA